MQKRQINAIIDLALLIFFIVVALSSIILFVFLPSGGGGGSGLRVFFGVRRSGWVDFHVIAGFIFLVLMTVHIVLHVPYYRKIRACLSSGKSRICDQK